MTLEELKPYKNRQWNDSHSEAIVTNLLDMIIASLCHIRTIQYDKYIFGLMVSIEIEED